MIRAVLFDKDGTFTDFRATWEPWMAGVIRDLAAAARAPDDAIATAFGFDLGRGRILDDGLFVTAPVQAVVAQVARATGWSPEAVALWLGPRNAHVAQVPVPGVAALLSRLRRAGLALGVVTNSDEEEAMRHLRAMDLLEHFDRVIACDSGFGAKPDPRGAADFAARLGIAPGDVALVGDGLPDMGAARGAGMVPVAVLTGTLGRDALAPHAAVVLQDVSHLPHWLGGRGVDIPAA